MTIEFYNPPFPLQHCIDSFIYYRGFEAMHRLDRLLPDGNVTLIIDLKEETQSIYDNDTFAEIQVCRHSWLSGIRSKPITIPSGHDSEMFIVNFHKGKAHSVVLTPLAAFTDLVVDGELIFGPGISTLRGILQEEPDILGKFRAAESYFQRRLSGFSEINPFIHFAVNQIMQAPEQQTISSLSDKVGFSHKHLIHLFKTHVGLTPKAFMRVMRFQKTIADIEKCRSVDWTQLACASGYYDQAHFIHDFRKFSGMTPQQYLAAKNDQLNYVPVA